MPSRPSAPIMSRTHSLRQGLIGVGQVALAGFTSWGALWLFHDGAMPDAAWQAWVALLPWLLAVRALAFWPFGLYSGLWRYAGVRESLAVAGGVGLGSLAIAGLVRLVGVAQAFPPVVLVLDALLLGVLLGAVRLSQRLPRDFGRRGVDDDLAEKRVLVFGAGDAGEMIVRDMQQRRESRYRPVGFIDDHPAKRGLRIHGVRVFGGRDVLPEVMARVAPDEVLLAMPSASLDVRRGVLTALQPYRVAIKTLPDLRELPECHVEVAQIRSLALEDLLSRPVVGLDPAPVRALVAGRRVLVTGAGGSIGSELCRQIARLGPASIVMVERHEHALFTLTETLRAPAGSDQVPLVADVTDSARMRQIMERHRPDVVFHAAAHKHVPLMDRHPCEAVKNNVLGTLTTARAADLAGVERFILISSDKAVDPASVMGATKRVAEMIVQSLLASSATSFTAVRFGNVLGSSGSVVPTFLRQIREGGPVTVTDAGMRRYFMLIAEAVELVQHAAALSGHGVVYVLDMGEPVAIVDLARQMIRLAGYVPDVEIPIVFVGRRPGEKLEEVLVGADERVEPSGVPHVRRLVSHHVPEPSTLSHVLQELAAAALANDEAATRHLLGRLVPTLQPERPPAGEVIPFSPGAGA